MPIEFSCPSCRQLVRTPDSAGGKKGKCPQCQTVVQIPPAPAAGKRHMPVTPLAQPKAPAGASRHAATISAAAPIEFFCVSCGQLVRTPATTAGKKGKCPHCSEVVQIPERKGSGIRGRGSHQTPGGRELTPVDGLEPLGPGLLEELLPQKGTAPHLSPMNPLAELQELTPLFDEALPPLAPLPAGALTAPNPFAAGPAPQRVFSDASRRGLPWERDPSTESFWETVRLVLSAPQEAFQIMRRGGGVGNPFGFFLLSAVFGNLLVVAILAIVVVLLRVIFVSITDPTLLSKYRWDLFFLSVGGASCIAIFIGLLTGLIGSLVSAAVYHVSLLACGAANGGFQTTYRVVAFGMGSVYMLFAIPLIGPLFGGIMQLVVLTFGFRSAHETSGGRAFLAALLPTLIGGLIVGFILLLYLPAIEHVLRR
jgi:phage FluMu protein Com